MKIAAAATSAFFLTLTCLVGSGNVAGTNPAIAVCAAKVATVVCGGSSIGGNDHTKLAF